MHPDTDLNFAPDRERAQTLLAKLPVDYVGRVPGGREQEEHDAIDAVVEFMQDVRRDALDAMRDLRKMMKAEGGADLRDAMNGETHRRPAGWRDLT